MKKPHFLTNAAASLRRSFDTPASHPHRVDYDPLPRVVHETRRRGGIIFLVANESEVCASRCYKRNRCSIPAARAALSKLSGELGDDGQFATAEQMQELSERGLLVSGGPSHNVVTTQRAGDSCGLREYDYNEPTISDERPHLKEAAEAVLQDVEVVVKLGMSKP